MAGLVQAEPPVQHRDLNPIEQFFAKFKHWLRKVAQRTTNAAECANYFANAGYDQT
jgi:transposase